MLGIIHSLPAQESTYLVKSWNTDNGLPQNSINDIIISDNGFMWVASFGGVAVFDGVRFKKAEVDRLRYARVNCLYQDFNGVIWFGTESNGIFFNDDTLQHLEKKDGLIGNGIADIVQMPDSSVIVSVQRKGLQRFKDGELETSPLLNLQKALIEQMIVGQNGNLWVASSNGLYFSANGESFRQIQNTQPLTDGLALTQDSLGRIWYAFDNKLCEVGIEGKEIKRIIELPFQVLSRQLAAGDNGSLFLTSAETEIYEFRNNKVSQLNLLGSIPSGETKKLFYRDHSLWVGLNGGGLIQLQNARVNSISAVNGLSNERCLAIYKAEDKLWIGTNSGALFRYNLNTEEVKEFETKWNNKTFDVWSICSDFDNNIWVGTYGQGVFKLNEEKKRFFRPKNLAEMNDVILSIYRDDIDSSLWFGSGDGGVFQFKSGKWIDWVNDTIDRARVTSIKRGPRNKIWITTSGDGVKVIEKGSVTGFKTQEIDNSIRDLTFDQAGNPWIASYGKGIFFVKNDSVINITEDDGLYDNLNSTITIDPYRYVWSSTNRGVYRFNISEVEAFVNGDIDRIRSEAFTQEDGMLSSETNGGFQPANQQSGDLIFYPTMKGVAIFNTNNIRDSKVVDKVHIESVITADTLFDDIGTRVRLPLGTRDFTVTYTAPHFDQPSQIQFEYQLQGYDEHWNSSAKSRFAKYTSLEPGTYTFLVRAKNVSGKLSNQVATLEVLIPSFYYETRWFKIGLGLFLTLVIALFFVYKRNMARIRERKLIAEVRSRTSELRKEKQITDKALKKIESQSEELQRINLAKSNFYANISHELKTPLTLIHGPSESILTKKGQNLDPQLRQEVESIYRNSKKLDKLIIELLDIAKSEDGELRIDKKPFDISSLMRQVLQSFNSLVQQKEINLQLSIPEQLFGITDPYLLEKIVSNLLSNAIKFTPQKGKIQFKVSSSNNKLQLLIQDSGEGIKEDDLPQVFEKFYTSSNSINENNEGNGIGLAIVKEFSESLGGTIKVENVHDSGAQFLLTLPIEIVNKEEISEELEDKLEYDFEEVKQLEEETEKDQDNPLLLIIDDNSEIRDLIRNNFRSEFRIAEAPNGKLGLEKAFESMPDMIVSDIMMPEMDGLEFLKKLKSKPQTASLAVLMLTAKGSVSTRINAWDIGADAYLAKPFSPLELKKMVLSIIRNRRNMAAKIQKELSSNNKQKEERFTSAFEREVMKLIEDNYQDPEFRFPSVLDQFAMSRSTFQRKVKKTFGMSSQSLLINFRLEKAKELLKDDSYNVAEIAYACGFNSISYFSRSFKEVFGKSPVELKG